MKTDLDHFLQLRLPKETVADIDDVIATASQLGGFNRCRFIRYAVRYALDSICRDRTGDGPKTKHHIEFEYESHFETDPEVANLHLWLTHKVFARMDAAMKFLSLYTRQDFAALAILNLLSDVEHDTGVAVLANVENEGRS
jgi:hypothetical protein